MKNYQIGLNFFIKAIKKEKILIFSSLNQNKKILNFVVQSLIRKNLLKVQKKEIVFSENFLPENLGNFFFQSFFHQEIFFQKNKNDKKFVFEILKNFLKMKKFSNSKKAKTLIIMNGLENLTIEEQEKLFSLLPNMIEDYWIILNVLKIENVLEIFREIFFFPTDSIFKLKKNNRKLYKKKLKNRLLKKDFIKFSNYWKEKNFNFFFFFFLKKNFKENIANKSLRDFSYLFSLFLEFLKKILKNKYSEKENQPEFFFFDELYFSKNLLL
ncbi:hypothetical protein HAN_3g455 (nucleomorph) [Hemiselmis andersenii]|uniref:Uncharacterized protein n=1 Tax=Hemiselmis andersenii TaxID=464988 RepID=A9BL74_HEMAN|nr:hypothetical protein HAN_3g455 [Hemiselmis andersenii]ABW98257.1 hypothetical protein HAN_3g455 [Hemiselmis andersenii]